MTRQFVMKLTFLFFSCVFFIANQSLAAEDKKDSKRDVADDEPDIKLESTFVGDKEQPAVSYFIPWQGNRTPDKLQWEMEQKHDTTLQLIDRDVMLRSINIYEDMNMENASSPSPE